MNLKNLKSLFTNNGCSKIYIKKLSPNDNSKNQVYFGGSFEILNILPISEIKNEEAGNWNKERFKASINFSWIAEDGKLSPAPNAQLILYPKYPEVRFSGFLAKCENPPSELMTQRLANRLLFFSVTKEGTVLGFVASPDSEIAQEFEKLNNTAIGREWNSLTMYKKLIQPAIVKKIGQIIEPMRINDTTNAKKLCEIIEKATKKKQRTKAKI